MRIEFPSVFNIRCTPEMRDEIKARGGARWLRKLIEANTRPPVNQVPFDGPYTPQFPTGTFTGNAPVTRRIRSNTRKTPDGRRRNRRVDKRPGRRLK